MSDATARQPTALEGWTIGHILTHVARNADAHSGIVEAAQRGEMVPMYPGGRSQRDGAIDAGQGRPAAELIADVRAAHQRLERAWATTSEAVWATGLGQRTTGPATVADFVFTRWREVAVHLVDLGMVDRGGPDWDGLNPIYVDLEWQATLPGLGDRVPENVTLVLVPGDRPSHASGKGDELAIVRATPGRILGWLFGRGGDPAWPTIRPWSY
jgi:maleylpyruvate isomerase